jgi:hypothetical protein
MRLTLLLFLFSSLLHADTLADLKQRLATLNGGTPVAAKVDYEFSNADGDDLSVKTEGRASARVEDGAEGITITWPRELITQADEEARAQGEAGQKKPGARRAIGAIGPVMAHDHLNAAPGLLQTLNQAELLEEKRDTWEGQPATLLVMKVTPRLSAQDRKYLKELSVTGRLWIGADGLPLAAEMKQYLKGRAYLVITFEATDRQEFRYTTVGDRLIMLRHAKENQGSGAGQRSRTTDLTTVQLQNPPPAIDGSRK